MALLARKDYSGGAVVTTLAADMTAGALTFSLTSATNWPTGGVDGKFTVTIDPGLPTEERLWGSSLTGTTVTIANLSDRGIDNTAVGAHTAGSVVIHSFSGLEADDANRHIYTTDDDHLQYMRADGTRHDTTARHPAGTVVPTAVPVAIGTALTEGAGTNLARATHIHTIGVGAVNNSNMFAADVVNSAAIGADQVGTSEIAPLAVDTAELADLSVTTSKINNTVYGTQTQAVGSAISHGASVTVSRSDHVHSSPFDDVVRLEGGGASLTASMANQFGVSVLTLAAGTWEIQARVRGTASISARRTQTARIRNTTDSTTLDSLSQGFDAATSDNTSSWSLIGWVTIASTKNFELQAQTSVDDGTQFMSDCKLWAKRIATLS